MWPRADSRPLDYAAARPKMGGEVRGEAREAAVIDVGSNSIRLVIYRVDGRALWTVYNEKVVAALGRDLPATGRLSPKGVEMALAALRRFRAVLDGWRPDQLTTAATAAVREAADGRAFLKRVKDETGFDIRLLSGEEEAHYAAQGVVAGDPQAKGVVGDLGGSSLELIRLNGAGHVEGATLPLGPFALGAPKPLDVDRLRHTVDACLTPYAARFAGADFHAVGGAWRNLALLHMRLVDYPLHVAHQYEMSRAEALEVTGFVERQSRASLERIQGLSKKRFDTLPYSALVLNQLIERLGVERVVISAYGVREGMLLEGIPPDVRGRDPLIEGCDALVAQKGVAPDLGPALEAWIGPAFEQLAPVFGGARDRLLLSAACRLADLGARLHPDNRADLAFEQVLRAPIAGMNHCERAFLASTAFARHSSAPQTPAAGMIARLLSPERRQRARALGAAVRLGCDLSGRNPRLLESSSLAVRGDRLTLTTVDGWQDMLLGEQVAKRAQSLAQALKLKLQMG